MLHTALHLAERDCAVFPLQPASKTPLAGSHGCLDATTDVIQIQAWWAENPNYNLGIACGAISGIFVVDVDGAETELARLEAQHGELPPTVEVITARGRHLYFKYPETPVSNTAGKIAEGIDTRSDGGYVLAPPSMHPSGRRYRWSVDSANSIAAAPAWLIELVAAPKNGNGATPASEWRALVANGVAEGQRNTAAAKLAGHLLRRFVDPVVTLDLVQGWNLTKCSPPLPAEEIHQIVDSIAGRELKRRGNG
jgi:hypothetical protein